VAEERLDGQRARQIRRANQHPRVDDREREQRLHRLGAVDQRKPLLRGQLQRHDPVRGQHLGGGPPAGRVPRPAQPPLPDQRLGQVRQLGQVPGRAHGTLAGNHGQQAEVEHLDQACGKFDPDPRVPRRERSGPEQEDGTDCGVVERLAGGGRVRADDGSLQPFQVAGADAGVGERAEPGVDPVDGRVALDRGGHH